MVAITTDCYYGNETDSEQCCRSRIHKQRFCCKN